jgi:hypothetical protein
MDLIRTYSLHLKLSSVCKQILNELQTQKTVFCGWLCTPCFLRPLFIYRLFNDSANSSYYIVSNDGVINE